MATIREIIEDAHAMLGIASDQFDLSTAEMQFGKRLLDRMMNQWSVNGNVASFSSSSEFDADSGIPEPIVEAVVSNLALKLAPSYGKPVPRELKVSAHAGLQSLRRQRVQVPQMKLPTSTPLGQGNRSSGYDDVFVNDVPGTLDGVGVSL